MQNELLDMDSKQFRDVIASGAIKSVAAVEAVFEAIEKYEPTLGAYISTFKERALRNANEVDGKIAAGKPVGNLAGEPVDSLARRIRKSSPKYLTKNSVEIS